MTNDLCKAITGAALGAVYLCMGLRHCRTHLHVGSVLIFHSHIPICLSPPPNVPPSSVMNSFSRFSLPISSPSSILPFWSLAGSPVTERRWRVRRWRNASWPRRRPQVPLSLFTARGDRCTLVCSAARGRKGWVYLTPPPPPPACKCHFCSPRHVHAMRSHVLS